MAPKQKFVLFPFAAVGVKGPWIKISLLSWVLSGSRATHHHHEPLCVCSFDCMPLWLMLGYSSLRGIIWPWQGVQLLCMCVVLPCRVTLPRRPIDLAFISQFSLILEVWPNSESFWFHLCVEHTHKKKKKIMKLTVTVTFNIAQNEPFLIQQWPIWIWHL